MAGDAEDCGKLSSKREAPLSKSLYAVASCLGAFLLFVVELLVAKAILPRFGGVPAVWTTSLVFFQVTLLVAYVLAHWTVARLEPRTGALTALAPFALGVTTLLLAVFVSGAPILPRPADGTPSHSPALATLGLLATSVGLPFLALATSSPLLQSWFARTHPGRSPYPLYAFSNLGSLLGLLSFPFLLEPWFSLRQLAWAWSALFLGFFALFARAAISATTLAPRDPNPIFSSVARRVRFVWFGLAALPSALLVAVSNQLARDVAVVPFLWVLPLSLYLISLVVCFAAKPLYHAGTTAAALVPWLAVALLTLQRGTGASLPLQFIVPCATLFGTAMLGHGELARRRPEPRLLTDFYLTLAAGGAAGSSLAALLPPLCFPDTWEYPLTLFVAALVTLLVILREPSTDRNSLFSPLGWLPLTAIGLTLHLLIDVELRPRAARVPEAWLFGVPLAVSLLALARRRTRSLLTRMRPDPPLPYRSWAPFIAAAAIFALVLDGVALAYLAYRPLIGARESRRNFFGVVQVIEDAPTEATRRVRLRNGRISHGYQLLDPERRREPTSYYSRQSGIGRVLESYASRERSLRVAVIGLGVGTLAAYARPTDEYRFYEVNPQVVELAGTSGRVFSFLTDAAGRHSVVLGDARASLESERDQARYDVIVLDAFSGDAIPLHLFTREALELYLSRLAPSGIIAANISNRYLRLEPVVSALAAATGLAHGFVVNASGEAVSRSTWAMLARNPLDFAPITRAESARPIGPLFRDDHSSLWAAVRW